MYKVLVLYSTPDSPPDFDRYYLDEHVPIAQQMTGLTRWTVTKFEPGPDGTEPAYYYAAELFAESRAALEAVLASAEGQAANADLANFAGAGATFLFGPDVEIEVR